MSSSKNLFYIYMLCCSVLKSCPTLWDPMDCSTPAFPVLHYFPEFAQIHVHWVDNAILPSHPLPPFFLLPFIFPSIRIFSWVILIYFLKSWSASLRTRLPETSLHPHSSHAFDHTPQPTEFLSSFKPTPGSLLAPLNGLSLPAMTSESVSPYSLPTANTGFLQAMSSAMAGAWLTAQAQ